MVDTAISGMTPVPSGVVEATDEIEISRPGAPAESYKATPEQILAVGTGSPFELEVAISDETTDITTGTAKITFYWPRAVELDEVFVGLSGQSSSGPVTLDVNKNGVSIFSTPPSVAASEDTSLGAGGTAAVLSTTAMAKGDKVTVDIDAAGTGAKGPKLVFLGTRA